MIIDPSGNPKSTIYYYFLEDFIMSYTIKETSKRTGLTLHTIRHYCDLDLIPSLQRDENNNRIFDEASIHWLYAIKFLRQSQMSLKEIRQFFEKYQYDPTKSSDRKKLLQKAIQVSDEKLQQTIQEHDRLKHELEAYLDNVDCEKNKEIWGKAQISILDYEIVS